MPKAFHCSIVTPAEIVLDQDVTYASIPAWDGQQGVMEGQSPLLTRLGVGTLRLDLPDGGSRWYLLDGGFAQIQADRLNLITERAIPANQLSMEEAQAELAEANARVAKPGEDTTKVERDQRRALAKKTLAQMVASRGGSV